VCPWRNGAAHRASGRGLTNRGARARSVTGEATCKVTAAVRGKVTAKVGTVAAANRSEQGQGNQCRAVTFSSHRCGGVGVMWRVWLDEVREIVWLTSIVTVLSILGVGLAVALAAAT
jgi:hypothetical protein